MKKLYFHINGSSSPFWIEEKKNNFGNFYFDDLFWPKNASSELKNSWQKISILFQTFSNPIDNRFPSFWTQSMCDLFNQLVSDFLNFSQSELNEFLIIDKYIKINQDERLLTYRQNIIKSHLEFNKIIKSEKELEDYFKFKNEIKSVLTSDLPFEEYLKIEQSEYDTLNVLTLCYGIYNKFQISVCPYSFKTYLANINLGGHGPLYQLIRINRQDIFTNPEKLISLSKNTFV